MAVYTNISPGNDLSSLSLAIVPDWDGEPLLLGGSTWGATVPATRPVTCRATIISPSKYRANHMPSNSPSSHSLSDSPRYMSLAPRHREQLFQRLAERLSRRATRPVVLSQGSGTEQFDIRNNSSSDYLQSDSLTAQIPCRTTHAAVILPATRSELCHWLARHKEQLFQRLLAYQATYLPNISPIDSPRALSLAEQISQQ
jgi:hypothetical protein